MAVDINFREVMIELNKELESIVDNQDRLKLTIALNVRAMHAVRIFDKGQNVNGRTFTLKRSTIKSKRSRGTFSGSKVNYIDTNQLNTDYQVGKKGPDVGIGLLINKRRDGETNRSVIEDLEDRFGTIFDINAAENKEIDEGLEDFIDQIFK